MVWISTSVLYYALFKAIYILTELIAKDVQFISVDKQKLDHSKEYGTVKSIFVEIQPNSTNIKNAPRIFF